MPRSLNVEMRQRIVSAAYRLFVECGYKSVSMEDIAQALGMKKANLFHYYPTKEALGLATLEMIRKDSRDRGEESLANATDPVEFFVAIFERAPVNIGTLGPGSPNISSNIVVEMAGSHDSLQRQLAADVEHWVSRFALFLRAWKEKGYFRTDLEEESLARLLVLIMQGSHVFWKATQSTKCFDDAAQWARATLEALRADPVERPPVKKAAHLV
jgi:TetR/AcrR family transcriptional regulator, transcriptional repressor for nem operon